MALPFLYIMRHGETPYNVERRLLGHLDIDLNENGVEHARKMGEYLKNRGIEKIYASDLRRAAHTAEIVSEKIEVPIFFEPDLREVRFGAYEGMKIEDAKKHGIYSERDRDRLNYCPPEGESYKCLLTRIRAFIEKVDLLNPAHAPALVVAHQGVNRMFCAELGIFPAEDAVLKIIGHESLITVEHSTNGIIAKLEDPIHARI